MPYAIMGAREAAAEQERARRMAKPETSAKDTALR
jgi:hypothetical protein